MYILPAILTPLQQEHWVRVALRSLIERPNRRNIDSKLDPDASNMMAAAAATAAAYADTTTDTAAYTSTPAARSFECSQDSPQFEADLWLRSLLLRRRVASNTPSNTRNEPIVSSAPMSHSHDKGDLKHVFAAAPAADTAAAPSPLSPSSVLSGIAWSTLGLQYDWTDKNYHLPSDLDYELHSAVHAKPAAHADGVRGAPSPAGAANSSDDDAPAVLAATAGTASAAGATSTATASPTSSRWSATVPPRLHTLSANIAATVNSAAGRYFAAHAPATATASPPCSSLAPGVSLSDHGLPMSIDAQSGITNVYQSAKKKLPMGAHVDDMERTVAHPVVSLSLGCTAVFLVGGATKEDAPVVPVLLRSGDAIILSGASRLAVHGVARIFDGSSSASSGTCSSTSSSSGARGCSGDHIPSDADFGSSHSTSHHTSEHTALAPSLRCYCSTEINRNGAASSLFISGRTRSPPVASLYECGCDDDCPSSAALIGEPGYFESAGVTAAEEEAAVAEFIDRSRININVRQVLATPEMSSACAYPSVSTIRG